MSKEQEQAKLDIKVAQVKRAERIARAHVDDLHCILDSNIPGLLRFIAQRLIDIQFLLELKK